MNTAKNLLVYVGKFAGIKIEGMLFTVKTLDAKIAYGKVLVQITPPWEDCGTKWIEGDRLTLGESF